MLDNLPIDLNELNFLTITVRSILAVLVGGIIGTERDIKNRAAGIRTHMLVCFGAATVMMTNQYAIDIFPDLDLDATRMGAQVISGIGFLGAGTILVTSHKRIRGLTTAAGLWTAATLGLAIGIGFYEMALVGIIAILFIVVFLRPFKQYVRDKTNTTTFTLMIYLAGDIDDFLDFTSDEEVKIIDLNIQNGKIEDENAAGTMIKVTLELAPDADKEDFIEYLKDLGNVNHVIEVETEKE